MTKDEQKVQSAPTFFVDGRMVNGKGQEVDEKGQVKGGDEGGAPADWVAEREQLLADLETARANALPADALERIKKVPKVADNLAQPILDALTAPAQGQ